MNCMTFQKMQNFIERMQEKMTIYGCWELCSEETIDIHEYAELLFYIAERFMWDFWKVLYFTAWCWDFGKTC